MASYERADALTQLIESKLKELNNMIQDMPDVSQFSDLVDTISGVSDYLGTLSSETDGQVTKELKQAVNELSSYSNRIRKSVSELKQQKISLSPSTYSIQSDIGEDKYSFLEKNFPPVSG